MRKWLYGAIQARQKVPGRFRCNDYFPHSPGGPPGIALLLLRAVPGVAMLVQGRNYISGPDPTFASWFLGLSALAAGCLFVIGFVTPFAGIIVGLGAVAVALSFLPACTPNIFASKPALIFALTMLLAVIGAGPGRFSVDVRVFGRVRDHHPIGFGAVE